MTATGSIATGIATATTVPVMIASAMIGSAMIASGTIALVTIVPAMTVRVMTAPARSVRVAAGIAGVIATGTVIVENGATAESGNAEIAIVAKRATPWP